MAYRLLRREGWTVNHKRVQRIWREEGLQRPTPRNIPTRCGPWTSSSTRPLMAADSSS
jgi:transposase InsO family protein